VDKCRQVKHGQVIGMLKKKILEEFEEHPVWTKHFGKKKENYVPARLNTRRLMGSTDQADPSCFYFRI
jgi:hypothetical protein